MVSENFRAALALPEVAPHFCEESRLSQVVTLRQHIQVLGQKTEKVSALLTRSVVRADSSGFLCAGILYSVKCPLSI